MEEPEFLQDFLSEFVADMADRMPPDALEDSGGFSGILRELLQDGDDDAASVPAPYTAPPDNQFPAFSQQAAGSFAVSQQSAASGLGPESEFGGPPAGPLPVVPAPAQYAGAPPAMGLVSMLAVSSAARGALVGAPGGVPPGLFNGVHLVANGVGAPTPQQLTPNASKAANAGAIPIVAHALGAVQPAAVLPAAVQPAAAVAVVAAASVVQLVAVPVMPIARGPASSASTAAPMYVLVPAAQLVAHGAGQVGPSFSMAAQWPGAPGSATAPMLGLPAGAGMNGTAKSPAKKKGLTPVELEASRRFRRRKKERLAAMEAEVAAKRSELAALEAERERLQARSDALQSLVDCAGGVSAAFSGLALDSPETLPVTGSGDATGQEVACAVASPGAEAALPQQQEEGALFSAPSTASAASSKSDTVTAPAYELICKRYRALIGQLSSLVADAEQLDTTCCEYAVVVSQLEAALKAWEEVANPIAINYPVAMHQFGATYFGDNSCVFGDGAPREYGVQVAQRLRLPRSKERSLVALIDIQRAKNHRLSRQRNRLLESMARLGLAGPDGSAAVGQPPGLGLQGMLAHVQRLMAAEHMLHGFTWWALKKLLTTVEMARLYVHYWPYAADPDVLADALGATSRVAPRA